MSISHDEHAVVMADAMGIICYWSAGATALFGFPRDEAVGQSLDLIVPEEFRERHRAGFERAVSSGSCDLDRATRNIPVCHKTGSHDVKARKGRSDPSSTCSVPLNAGLQLTSHSDGRSGRGTVWHRPPRLRWNSEAPLR